jgi:hypothetical protein
MCYLEADHAIKIRILYVISNVILLYDNKKKQENLNELVLFGTLK